MTEWKVLIKTFGGAVSLLRDLTQEEAFAIADRLRAEGASLMDYHGFSNRQGSWIPGHGCPDRRVATAADIQTAEVIGPGGFVSPQDGLGGGHG